MPSNTTILSGGLVVDKPAGMTSHDVVAQIRRLLPRGTRVGHSGTLDPFATGVLMILLGPATRLVEYLHALPKTYRTSVTLGATSTTDDLTGQITPVAAATPPLIEQVEAALPQFRGKIKQVPPHYAAIKVGGKKLYEYARAGKAVERTARTVTIYALHLLEYRYPTLTLEVTCSSGTYIRSLARDTGEALQTGGYAATLQRTAIGPWTSAAALEFDRLTTEEIQARLLPPAALVAHLPPVTLSPENVAKLRQGRAVDVTENVPRDTSLALFNPAGVLIGIGHVDNATALLHPDKML